MMCLLKVVGYLRWYNSLNEPNMMNGAKEWDVLISPFGVPKFHFLHIHYPIQSSPMKYHRFTTNRTIP